MESSRDKLVALVDTVEDNAEEKDQDQLNELGEEMEHNSGNVVSMAQMVKGTINDGLCERAQRAFGDSVEAAWTGQQKLAGLRTRLEFHSMDSEAGSYIGGPPRGTGEVAPWQPSTTRDLFFRTG
jgi:hypothetical protein